MKKTKNLGTRISKNGKKQCWAEFKCPYCFQIVERLLGNGLKQKSCGCNEKQFLKEFNTKHGETGTRLYRIWSNIKQRCTNVNYNQFYLYGGRGISICPEWTNDYTKFRDWALIKGYADNLQIDRRNTDGNYEPNNCRWSTPTENARNKRNNVVKSMKMANEIRALSNTGNYTQQELAEKYNIDQTHISRIIQNKTWKE